MQIGLFIRKDLFILYAFATGSELPSNTRSLCRCSIGYGFFSLGARLLYERVCPSLTHSVRSQGCNFISITQQYNFARQIL